jgi:hypothetical protein
VLAGNVISSRTQHKPDAMSYALNDAVLGRNVRRSGRIDSSLRSLYRQDTIVRLCVQGFGNIGVGPLYLLGLAACLIILARLVWRLRQ